MDESWRMRMGMPNLPRRKSTEETSSNHAIRRNLFASEPEALDPDDFSDVFGGPPRTVLSRKFSREFNRSTSFYEEVFRPPDPVFAPSKSGRNLPAFRIPASRGCGGGFGKSEGFYGDIFGSDDDDGRSRSKSWSSSKRNSKSMSKSKSNSSSVLSSEELSPHRPVTGDDVTFSMFASKLRPINIPCKWNSFTMMHEEYKKRQGMPAFPCNPPSYVETQLMGNEYTENLRSSYSGFSRRVLSPETISLEPNSYGSIKISVDDFEINSPSSAVSSLCQEPEAKAKIQDNVMQEQAVEQEEDEVMSSYVIEITSDHREGNGEAIAIDEAIAWAKEKYQSQSSENEWGTRQREKEQSVEMEEMPGAHEFSDQQIGRDGAMQSPVAKEPKKWAKEEENQQSEEDDLHTEMELLDEDTRLWSSGKEANIQLLLSTLHHILWPSSGWHAISLTNLIEASHVKKAYQKARLCLHPDKLQQRGATLPQKYVAAKAFSILQDAWAAFIAQDVFS